MILSYDANLGRMEFSEGTVWLKSHTRGIGDAATRRFLMYGNMVMFHWPKMPRYAGSVTSKL